MSTFYTFFLLINWSVVDDKPGIIIDGETRYRTYWECTVASTVVTQWAYNHLDFVLDVYGYPITFRLPPVNNAAWACMPHVEGRDE